MNRPSNIRRLTSDMIVVFTLRDQMGKFKQLWRECLIVHSTPHRGWIVTLVTSRSNHTNEVRDQMLNGLYYGLHCVVCDAPLRNKQRMFCCRKHNEKYQDRKRRFRYYTDIEFREMYHAKVRAMQSGAGTDAYQVFKTSRHVAPDLADFETWS